MSLMGMTLTTLTIQSKRRIMRGRKIENKEGPRGQTSREVIVTDEGRTRPKGGAEGTKNIVGPPNGHLVRMEIRDRGRDGARPGKEALRGHPPRIISTATGRGRPDVVVQTLQLARKAVVLSVVLSVARTRVDVDRSKVTRDPTSSVDRPSHQSRALLGPLFHPRKTGSAPQTLTHARMSSAIDSNSSHTPRLM